MSTFLTAIIVLTAIIIIFVVIMQPSKDGGLGGLASGGGVTDSVFGAGRNEFLAKSTWWLMIIFLVSSIALAKNITTEKDALELEQNTKSAGELAAEPKKDEVDQLKSADATEPKKADATEPKKTDATEPKKTDATEPKKTDATETDKTDTQK